MCITGDFNFPRIKWDNASLKGEDNKFVETIRDCFLSQMIVAPTRNRDGQESNILDLVLVNNPDIISDIKHNSPLGASDHDIITFYLHVLTKETNTDSEKKYNFKKRKL